MHEPTAFRECHDDYLDRSIVFQEHRLFPWLSVRQNVGLAIEEAPLSKAEKTERVQSRID